MSERHHSETGDGTHIDPGYPHPGDHAWRTYQEAEAHVERVKAAAPVNVSIEVLPSGSGEGRHYYLSIYTGAHEPLVALSCIHHVQGFCADPESQE